MHQPVETVNSLFEFYTQWLGQEVFVHYECDFNKQHHGLILCCTPDVIVVLLDGATEPVSYSMSTLKELHCADDQPTIISEAPAGAIQH
jgi:hypothetical protein